MQALEDAGSEQNRKVYRRHGIGGAQFGVSYAALAKLAKKIKTDHELAQQLWKTGNHDARVLATMIADPEQATEAQLEAWREDLDQYVICDAFVRYFVSRTPVARKKAEAWSRSDEEWSGRAGWLLLASVAMSEDREGDAYFEKRLAEIEEGIHQARNRVRDAMNGALIGIGLRNARLRTQALAAARRIGKVHVDHGETGCKTPDAAAYIERAQARRKRK